MGLWAVLEWHLSRRVALGLGSAGRHHVSVAEQSPSEVQNPSS